MIEKSLFALDQICDSLSCFNVEILRKVQVSLLTPEPIEGEEQKEIPLDDLLVQSILFNPENLFNISQRYGSAGPSAKYKKLWTKLIDEEVEAMPRTMFLGSNEKSNTKSSESNIKAVSNPSFCNALVFETFEGFEFANIDDCLKCIRARLIPLIPSTNTLFWYIRPHLTGWLTEAVNRILKKIDDQRIKKQLCDYEFLIKNLKSGTSPQALSNLLMIISAVIKSGLNNQVISENYVFTAWINAFTKKLNDISDFKAVVGNEEFLTAFAISASVLAGSSMEIDAALADSLDYMILQNSKSKDGLAVYSAIEALSKVSTSKINALLTDKTNSSKRRLVAYLSCMRFGKVNPEIFMSDKPDDIELMIKIISKKESVDKVTFTDPIEFKGLAAYVQSLVSPEDICAKAEQRAFDSGSIPAALKYDAIFSYLLGSGLDLITLRVSNEQQINFRGLETSTKDSKCLALLQLVTFTSSSNTSTTVTKCEGFERFNSLSWFKFIGSLQYTPFKFDVLSDCKFLPRVSWPSPVPFDFALKHVLSITPITKVPFINPSLLPTFLENVFKFIKCNGNLGETKIKGIIEVLYNNSDDKSVSVLYELLHYCIETDGCDELLRIILEESSKYSQNLLNAFPFSKLEQLKPERIIGHAKLFKKLLDKLNLENGLLFEIKEDSSNVFSELKKIIERENNDLLLSVFGLQIRKLSGKARISASVSIIDLMFMYQQNEAKFELLSKLLHEIFIDMELILLESKKCFEDQEIIGKFKSRSSVIPKDIFDQFESAITATEFDNISF